MRSRATATATALWIVATIAATAIVWRGVDAVTVNVTGVRVPVVAPAQVARALGGRNPGPRESPVAHPRRTPSGAPTTTTTIPPLAAATPGAPGAPGSRPPVVTPVVTVPTRGDAPVTAPPTTVVRTPTSRPPAPPTTTAPTVPPTTVHSRPATGDSGDSGGSRSPSGDSGGTSATTSTTSARTPGPGTDTTTATFTSDGGTATVHCDGDQISLVSASPNDGYALVVVDSGPDRVVVHFDDGDRHSVIAAVCSSGTPQRLPRST